MHDHDIATEVFAEALGPALRDQVGTVAELGALLCGAWQTGRGAHGQIELSLPAFVNGVARSLQNDRPLRVQLEEIRFAELYLAIACTKGNERAIARLEALHGDEFEAAAAKGRPAGLAEDDVKQLIRHKLFVGDNDSPPALTRYDGRGALGRWLRVTSIRVALNAGRRKQPKLAEFTDHEAFVFGDSPLRDPELEYLKNAYRSNFREAFVKAVNALEPRQVTLLRQSIVHGLSSRSLGRMYGVHHATAARWIGEARASLVRRTRAELRSSLDVSADELDSIIAMIESRLDVSVARVLGKGEKPAQS